MIRIITTKRLRKLEEKEKSYQVYRNLKELLSWCGEFKDLLYLSKFLRSIESGYPIWQFSQMREKIRKIRAKEE